MSKPASQAAVRRVRRYEPILDELLRLLARPDATREELLAVKEKADDLAAYYQSRLWQRDYRADEAGGFPPELRRGVLSQDGIYNALEAYRERLDSSAFLV